MGSILSFSFCLASCWPRFSRDLKITQKPRHRVLVTHHDALQACGCCSGFKASHLLYFFDPYEGGEVSTWQIGKCRLYISWVISGQEGIWFLVISFSAQDFFFFFFLVAENKLSLASSENLRRRKRKGFRKEGALQNGWKAIQSIVCREQILPRLVFLQG